MTNPYNWTIALGILLLISLIIGAYRIYRFVAQANTPPDIQETLDEHYRPLPDDLITVYFLADLNDELERIKGTLTLVEAYLEYSTHNEVPLTQTKLGQLQHLKYALTQALQVSQIILTVPDVINQPPPSTTFQDIKDAQSKLKAITPQVPPFPSNRNN